jgi:hypothetical protein
LVDVETVRATAVVVLISVTKHVASSVGGDLWRDGVTAVAFLRILDAGKGVVVGVACIQTELDCHCSGTSGHGHGDGE